MMFNTVRVAILLITVSILLQISQCQKKQFSVEVYPSEIDEDNSIIAGDGLYRDNMRSLWNNVNPYMGYSGNPYMMPPSMPMFGYSQPNMSAGGGYNMGMAAQRSYSTPNPANFNYPKLSHLKGNQYNNYPKFQEKEKEQRENAQSAGLAKELEKEIKELQKLTKEAKDLAKKKLIEEKEKNNRVYYSSQTAQNNNKNRQIGQNNNKKLRKSNLDKISLEPKEKSKFDEGIKKIMEKLDKLN